MNQGRRLKCPFFLQIKSLNVSWCDHMKQTVTWLMTAIGENRDEFAQSLRSVNNYHKTASAQDLFQYNHWEASTTITRLHQHKICSQHNPHGNVTFRGWATTTVWKKDSRKEASQSMDLSWPHSILYKIVKNPDRIMVSTDTTKEIPIVISAKMN